MGLKDSSCSILISTPAPAVLVRLLAILAGWAGSYTVRSPLNTSEIKVVKNKIEQPACDLGRLGGLLVLQMSSFKHGKFQNKQLALFYLY
jgi:hypothetical protein